MLTVAATAPPTMAWQAVWDNISQSAQLICCANGPCWLRENIIIILCINLLICEKISTIVMKMGCITFSKSQFIFTATCRTIRVQQNARYHGSMYPRQCLLNTWSILTYSTIWSPSREILKQTSSTHWWTALCRTFTSILLSLVTSCLRTSRHSLVIV